MVVAYAVDRLSRNQNHIGVLFDEVEQAGARLEFVTEKFEDTAIRRFILAARPFIGEVEREKIAERQPQIPRIADTELIKRPESPTIVYLSGRSKERHVDNLIGQSCFSGNQFAEVK